jgi:energy-coupling factor transporter ATP-binding protein EcfA2
MLFADTVREEIAFGMKRLRRSRRTDADGIAADWGLDGYLEIPPRLLSYGEQHMLGMAALSAAAPKLLLLDDPLTALDSGYRRTAVNNLARLASETACAVLAVGHDERLPFPAHRSLRHEGGRLVPH